MTDDKFIKNEEKAVRLLRSLYSKYGYLPYKMNKFEEYDLYVRNKDFLVSDRVITFNDTDGSLMALKPDVTLSIIKNGDDAAGVKQKVCYNEHVYRVSDSTGRFREIMQTGLECIGDIDAYDIYEVISLAAQSLSMISDSYMLEVSHLGVISSLIDEACDDPRFAAEALSFIAEKNRHDLKKLCTKYGLSAENTDKVLSLVTVYGNRRKVIDTLRPLCREKAKAALDELELISSLLDNDGISDRVIFDFSVINDKNYYNGVVFRGFLDGICDGVLSGGQYDSLMKKMGRTSGAAGFALYLDKLEQLRRPNEGYDVDILLLYDKDTDKQALASAVKNIVAAGNSVSAQKSIPEKLRYREITDIRGGSTC